MRHTFPLGLIDTAAWSNWIKLNRETPTELDRTPKVGVLKKSRVNRSKGLGPVFNWTQSLQLYLDASLAIPSHVLVEFGFELLNIREVFPSQKFFLEVSEEVFRHGVVETVGFTAHRLGKPMGFQRFPIT